MESQDLVTVYNVNNPIEAEVIRNLLHAEGIACEVGGEGQAGLAGVLEIDILARAIDADRARKIIQQYHSIKKG